MVDRPHLGFFVAFAILALAFVYGAYRAQWPTPHPAAGASAATSLTSPSASGSLDAELAFQPLGHKPF